MPSLWQETSDMKLGSLTPKQRLYLATEEKLRRLQRRYYYRLFPDKGDLRRELYPKHIEFFDAGRDYMERCFMAANRIGKTLSGGFEGTAHLTGDYRHWWTGKVFEKPTDCWFAGKTNQTTRDIIQKKVFGNVIQDGKKKTVDGTGIMPGDLIEGLTWKPGIPDAIDTAKIKHVSGKYSLLGLKSYEQGRGSFEGTDKHFIWLDEECPMDVYNECLIRIMTTNGLVALTFTPLAGLTDVAQSFLTHDIMNVLKEEMNNDTTN